jgi:hypothetical protein
MGLFMRKEKGDSLHCRYTLVFWLTLTGPKMQSGHLLWCLLRPITSVVTVVTVVRVMKEDFLTKLLEEFDSQPPALVSLFKSIPTQGVTVRPDSQKRLCPAVVRPERSMTPRRV